jgi:hypothetical protein
MSAICTTKAKVLASKKLKATNFQRPAQRFRRGSKASVSGAVADTFDFPTQLVGMSSDNRAGVYVDPATGAAGMQNAEDILEWLSQINKWHDAIFGFKGGRYNVIVAAVNGASDGSGGAYHYGCDFSTGADLYVDTATGNSPMVLGLVAAELSEAYMGPNASLGQTQPLNWGCGYSNGEALSRRCAEECVALIGAPGVMDGYATASSWDGSDWITKTEQTDQDYVSIGAGACAIDWLVKNGHPLYAIAQAPGDTLADAYEELTGQPGTGFLGILWPAVQAVGTLTNDYPFTGGPNPSGAIPGGSSPPPPPPPPPPGLVPLTGTLDPVTYAIVMGPVTPPAPPTLGDALSRAGLSPEAAACVEEFVKLMKR